MTKFTLSCQCLIGPCSVLRFKGLPSSCRCAVNQGSFSTSDEFLQTVISSSGNCCDGITLIKRGQILKIKIRTFGLKMILMTSNLILALKRVSGSQQLPNVK